MRKKGVKNIWGKRGVKYMKKNQHPIGGNSSSVVGAISAHIDDYKILGAGGEHIKCVVNMHSLANPIAKSLGVLYLVACTSRPASLRQGHRRGSQNTCATYTHIMQKHRTRPTCTDALT